MVKREALKSVGLALLALVFWACYFLICSAPSGATFIYADF
jgi:hypothetical protein